MAKVTETRVKISLTDAMSGPLRKIEGEATATSKAVTNLGNSLKNYSAIGAQMAAGAFGFSTLTDSISKLVSAGLEFNKTMETNAVGMAGILTSMTTVNGKNMEWNQALLASQGIIKGLNEDALKTAATSEELVETFRALLGPGLGAGMKIDEIQKLTTTGVNAVKSLGLSGPQLVQELRDLVQGGITPASSTLATALGLTDADIKAAKASSEGLFKFLMERLRGFERAAQETPKTIAGMEDQMKEGLTKAMSLAVEPVQEKYKELLQQASGALFSDGVNIDQSLVDTLQSAGTHAANMVDDFKKLGELVAPVVVPAVEFLGAAVGVALDNAGKLTAAFVAWKLGQHIVSIKEMGRAWLNAGQQVQLAAANEMQAAEQAAGVVRQAEDAKKQALKETQTVQRAYSRLIAEDQSVLAIKLKMAAGYYERLGLSAEKAAKLQYQAAQLAVSGNATAAEKVLDLQEQHLQAASAANEYADKLNKLTERAGYFGGAMAALGIVLQSVTDDTDSLAYSTGHWLTMAGMAIDGIAMMITALGKLATAYKEVAWAQSLAGMAKVGAGALTIGAGVGAATVGLYAATHDLSWDDIKSRYFDNPDKKYWDMAAANTDDDNADSGETAGSTGLNIGDIKAKKFAGGASKKSKKNKSAEKEAERAAKRLERETDKIHTLQKELNRKILEDTGEAGAVATAKLDEELAKMELKLKEAAKAGVPEAEIERTKTLMQTYAEAEKRLANNNELIKAHQQRMDFIQAEQDAHKLTAQEADAQRLESLEVYKQNLQEILNSQQLTTSQRLQIVQEYANAVKDMETASASDYKAAWEGALEYIKNKTYDQKATIEAGIDEMLDSFTNFGQNMLTESKSISERFDDLFKNLANSIMNTMMKVIMQGLVMKSIMGILGGGVKTGSGYGSMGDIPAGVFIGGKSAYANGGVAEGWSLVGEKGPELVNFSQPGRVYTADQTAKALSGGAGLNNVKVVIENKTGQQVRATQANVSVDIKGYIINVVLEAVANNDGGINNILKGAMA